MTATQTNEFVKATAAETIKISDFGTQIDRYTWAIPVEVDGETRYAKVSITAALAKATKTNPAFDLDTAVEAFNAAEAERKAKEAEKAAKAAAKVKD
jgi:hypothetical protein